MAQVRTIFVKTIIPVLCLALIGGVVFMACATINGIENQCLTEDWLVNESKVLSREREAIRLMFEFNAAMKLPNTKPHRVLRDEMNDYIDEYNDRARHYNDVRWPVRSKTPASYPVFCEKVVICD